MMDDYPSDKEFIANNPKAGFTHTFSQLENIGEQSPVKDILPSPDDLATICYTSGTTGNRKGVITT